MAGNDSSVRWLWYSARGPIEVFRADLAALMDSLTVAVEVFLNTRFSALGDKTLPDILTFEASDQKLVDTARDRLVARDPDFSRAQGVSPRHALAASVLAFEHDSAAADEIGRLFVEGMADA